MTRRPAFLLLLLLAAASALLGQIQITSTSPLPGGYTSIAYGYNFTATTQPAVFTVTWSTPSATAPDLPPGLTLATNGYLSGTPTQTGTFTFTIIASGQGFTSTMQFSLTVVTPTVVINTTSPLPNGFVGQGYSLTLSASSNPAGVVWPETKGLPPGLTLSLNGILSGVPTAPGTYVFNLTAEIQGTSVSTTMTVSLTIYSGQVVIQTTTLPQAVVGKAYSTTLSASPQQITWTLSGLLPAGITFNTTTGVFSGTSGVTGTFPLQVTASLTNYLSASQNLILYVTSGPLTIPQPTLPPAVQGSSYTTTVGVSGGLPPYQWTFLNPANNGLTISSSGTITGTPIAAGSFLFPVSVTDGTGTTASNALSLFVATPLSVGTASLPNGSIGVAYSQVLLAAGGTSPYSWILTPGSGPLPPGLSLSTAGTLSGTPTGGGSYPFTVQVTDSGGRTATRTLTLSISVGPLSITTSSLPSGQLTVAYSQTVTATGGVLPYTWQLASGGLPAGLSLNTSTGVISGKPTGPLGNSTFTVQVTDSSPGTPLTAQKAFSINISLTLSITTLSLPAGTQGVAYPSTQIAASGGTPPYTWSIASGALPPGLSLGTSSGAITGTPTATGSTVFTVVVTDSAGQTANSQLSLTINPPQTTAPLTITTSGTFPAPFGVAFTLTLAATGGTPPYTWSATGLPAGLQVANGVISGTPTTAGTANVALTVTDSKQQTAAGAIAIDVSPPPSVSIGTISNVAATQAPPVVTLSSPYPVAITGTLTASFQSAVGGSPTEVGFVSASGGLAGAVQFTIPANGTAGVFQNSPVLATGTVAGTITITASITNAATGANITPTPAPTETITIQPAPPVIENVTFSNTGGGLTVTVVGYSTTLQMNTGQFQFYTSSGPILTPLTVQLTSAFSTWYSSSAASPHGSQFTLTVPFSVSGNASDVTYVNATLTNSQGNSNSLETIPGTP